MEFRPSPHRAWAVARDKNVMVHACGWAEADGRMLKDADLAGYFLARPDPEPLRGRFALVLEAPDKVLLAVDQVRSIPLFYRVTPQGALVSDQAGALADPDLPDAEALDPDSLLEFAAAGYVTGSRTLYRGVTGVQAGEKVRLGRDGIRREEYYGYRCANNAEPDVAALCAAHGRALDAAFERTIRSLDGRQAVVPLSGGLDSRLVAERLARSGYPRVICFSYGLTGNFEFEGAGLAAQRLGLPWVQLEYTPEALARALSSPEFLEYGRFASAGVSAPHPDDWLAVKKLKEQGLADKDAVFLPGHTGDFLCGSHLKYLFDPEESAGPLDFDAAMIAKHYSLWERLARDGRARRVFRERMDEALGGIGLDTGQGAAQAYEFWEWRERQAKFIINSVRVYEYFGFGWRIPLWDREYMDFWRSVPVDLKLDKFLYRSCLEADDPYGVFEGLSRPLFDRAAAAKRVARKRRRPSRLVKRALGLIPGVGRLLWYLGRIDHHARTWERHPTGLARLYPRRGYVYGQPGKRHSMALFVRDFLAREHGTDLKDLPLVSPERLDEPPA